MPAYFVVLVCIQDQKKEYPHEPITKNSATAFVIQIYPESLCPYRGAGIVIDEMDFANYHVRVKMPLTRKNQNIVGVHFGGSLYSMVDPFICYY